jgi:hypothetical protein
MNMEIEIRSRFVPVLLHSQLFHLFIIAGNWNHTRTGWDMRKNYDKWIIYELITIILGYPIIYHVKNAI